MVRDRIVINKLGRSPSCQGLLHPLPGEDDAHVVHADVLGHGGILLLAQGDHSVQLLAVIRPIQLQQRSWLHPWSGAPG